MITEPRRLKSKPYLLCMWRVVCVCTFSMSDRQFLATRKSRWGSFIDGANQRPAGDHLGQKPQEGWKTETPNKSQLITIK